ncbi:hypothetical protein Lal_00020150 [Lupinus albus]|nr:hypothetical protein Lal_00020150 [Lupinus albus]
MGLMLLKKFSLIFLLISSSLLSTSFSAGRRSKFNNMLTIQENEGRSGRNEEEVGMIEERLLRDNARDYGRYDPTPAMNNLLLLFKYMYNVICNYHHIIK